MEKEALKYADGINKNAAREAQREADVVAERLLKTCSEPKRDLGKIAADIADLRSRTSMLKPAQSYDLSKDWRLVFASDDDAISVVGTGLHKLPLTRIQVRREPRKPTGGWCKAVKRRPMANLRGPKTSFAGCY